MMRTFKVILRFNPAVFIVWTRTTVYLAHRGTCTLCLYSLLFVRLATADLASFETGVPLFELEPLVVLWVLFFVAATNPGERQVHQRRGPLDL